MEVMHDAEYYRLDSGKDQILNKVRKVLDEVGLDNYEIQSIGLSLKRGLMQCPAGTEPVWVCVRKGDGTLVYEWVCK